MLCLRQGYHCKCEQCQIWIDQWEKELSAFSEINTMMREGKTLFQIYEWLRASQPDIIWLYHGYIEKLYIELKSDEQQIPQAAHTKYR